MRKISEYNGTGLLVYRDLPHIILRYLNSKTIKSLDYGCGTGDSTRILCALEHEVVAVDTNKDMLSYAIKKNLPATYKLIKNAQITYPDSHFDLALSCLVMMEVDTINKLLEIFNEINRVLKDDGIFIFVVASEHLYKHNWLTIDTNFPENKGIKSGDVVKVVLTDIKLTIYDYFWTEKDYDKIILQSNFFILEKIYTYGNTTDGYNWVSEDTIPPFIIYVLKKSTDLPKSKA